MFLLSEAMFVILAIFGVLVTNFQTCLTATVNADKDVKSQNTNTVNAGTPEICETPECKSTASWVLSNMDSNVNPCDNIYQFSCGKFISKTVIPKDKSRVFLHDTIDDQIHNQLKDSIEKLRPEKGPATFKILKSIYNSCMDTTRIEKNSEQEMRDILKTLGGWPVVEGGLWDESAFDWQRSVVIFRTNGYGHQNFIGFSINVDLKNSKRFVIQLDQPVTKLSKDYLSKGLEDTVVKAYLNYMVDLAEIFGANREAAEKELTESLNFEMEIAKISLSNADREDLTKLYNPMTIRQLQATYNYMQWRDYINGLLSYTKVQVSYEETVIVAAPSYFQQFSELIAKTPKRVLANYALWRAVAESAPSLSERVLKAFDKYEAVFSGTSVRPPRWSKCLDYVVDYVTIAANALYVRDYFNDPTSKAEATDMVENLRKSYEGLITQVDWMDEKTKQAAIEKLRNTQAHIGYPSEYLDDRKLDEYYQSLQVHPDSLLRNDNSLYFFQITKSFERLRKPFDRNDWVNHDLVATANARYSFGENSLMIAAGLLQGPFFNKDRPKYMNYGSVGETGAHELTHGMDNRGSQYDKDGNLKDWWQPDTKKRFLEEAECFVRQYSNYEVKEVRMKVNGKNTEGENIADNGGVKVAYLAYKEWEKQHGQEAQLPGLPYTSQQMFWISYVMTGCIKIRPEALKEQIISSPHSPEEFRAIGPLSNMPEFAVDFGCPSKSPMNPDNKCKIW